MLTTGIDVIRISRVRRTLERFGSRFLDRVFTAAEREDCERKHDPLPSYAVRFAAKEAVFKAIGGSCRPRWRCIEVVRMPGGKPQIRLHGELATRFSGLDLAVALSHEGDWAVASVVAASPFDRG